MTEPTPEAGYKICIPTFLVVTSTFVVMGLIALLFFVDIKEGNRTILQGVIVTVTGVWLTEVGFYFGSSRGSEKKTDAALMQATQQNKTEDK